MNMLVNLWGRCPPELHHNITNEYKRIYMDASQNSSSQSELSRGEPSQGACPQNNLPIGVFDSGVGGLTVLAALDRLLPHENMVYLADAARLPYGAKSAETVARYSLEAANFLIGQNIKALVIACNTATAAALKVLHTTFPQLPIIGVIKPGARAAVDVAGTGTVLVLATEGTINNGAYTRAIQMLSPETAVVGVPCPLFVPLAEEGWGGEKSSAHGQEEYAIVKAVAQRYLGDYFSAGVAPDCVLLGCTHYPHLESVIREVVGPKVGMVDSAKTTAEAVLATLTQKKLLNGQTGAGNRRFLTTDSPERFRRVGSIFLDKPIENGGVELVTLS